MVNDIVLKNEDVEKFLSKEDAKELRALIRRLFVSKKCNNLNGNEIHELKTIRKYFDAVCDDKKTFEVRKDDRNFQVGDTLRLMRYTDGTYDYAICDVKIKYILGRNEDEKMYVPDGYVILGIK